MQLKHLNDYAFTKLKGKVILFTAFIAVLAISIYFHASFTNDKNKAEERAKNLEHKITVLKQAINKSEESIEIWNNIGRKKHGKRIGLRVEPARNIIDQLKQLHRINQLAINLSNPIERGDLSHTKHTTIAYSIVTMSFNSYTDADAFRFINSVIRELPGHVQIKNLSMIGTDVLTDELLESIGSGDFTNVVAVKVEFVWQDIQDKNGVRK